jgi:hypothetical protein
MLESMTPEMKQLDRPVNPAGPGRPALARGAGRLNYPCITLQNCTRKPAR